MNTNTALEQLLAAGWIRLGPNGYTLLLPQLDLWNDTTWAHPIPCSIIRLDFDCCEEVKPLHVSLPLSLFRKGSYNRRDGRIWCGESEIDVESEHLPYDPHTTTDFRRAKEEAFNNSLEVLLNTPLFNGTYRDVLLGPPK